ncbi:MAG: glycosyltransferase [Eubacterium sp.]|nr:glycosyltransferase [Eubacterium sp.]
MKLLTVTVPCYNSQDYMEHCINSILIGGEDVEILIVDDGSTDDTAKIADEYERRYPTICRAIHKPNGGHGSAVNAGIENATGEFFKVVDSDDWLDGNAFLKVLDKLRENMRLQKRRYLDMLIANFIYDKDGARHKHTMQYKSAFPVDKVISWKDCMKLRKGRYILMHSVIYRTQILRDCGLKLPEHTFYVDNLYVYTPLPYVKYFMYMDVDLYHYYIGREDQSVNEATMIKNIDQQLKVTRMILEAYNLESIKNDKLRKYMYNYAEIMVTVSTVLLLRDGTKESLAKKKELWRYLRKTDIVTYKKMRKGFFGVATNIPGRGGRWFAVRGYRLARKIVGFS